jgi:hypothetical protein
MTLKALARTETHKHYDPLQSNECVPAGMDGDPAIAKVFQPDHRMGSGMGLA